MSCSGARAAIGVLICLLVLLPACGSGRDEEDSDRFPGECLPPFTEGLTGTWSFQEILEGETCLTTGLNRGTFFLLQDYRALTFTGISTIWTATLCGSRATATPFSFPKEGGVHTVKSLLIQFSSPNRASGSTTWSWTNGSESCEGTSTFEMIR